MKKYTEEINLGNIQDYYYLEEKNQFFIYGSKLTVWSSNFNPPKEIIK